MANNLFNSTFEVELRILCLLNSGRKVTMSTDRIVYMDFIVCYAGCFQLPYINLHGDNDYMYGELANRKELVGEAVKSLVVQGLLNVTIDRGYLYSISDSGRKYIKQLKSEYAVQYKEIAADAIKAFKKNSDGELARLIQGNAVKALKGGQ